MLEVINITKFYGHKNKSMGCKEVSFSLQTGCVGSLLGLNGAGKSTVLNIISGCLQPDSGEVFINGKAASEDWNSAKKHLGVLYEQNPLYADMTVTAFLQFSAGMHGMRDYKAACGKVIEFCNLSEVKNSLIKNLSKGFKQRTGIAQALIHNPEVLILDEPASGLDTAQLKEFQNKILEISPQKSILMSTHNLQQAAKLCSKHILMHNGKIVVQGSLEEIEQLIRQKIGAKANFNGDILETAFDIFAGVKKDEFFQSVL